MCSSSAAIRLFDCMLVPRLMVLTVGVFLYLFPQCQAMVISSQSDRYSPIKSFRAKWWGQYKQNHDLLIAATRNDILQMRSLADNGANVNGNPNWPPVYFAAVNDKPQAVALLLDLGADADLPNLDGDTALIAAAECGYNDIVKLLLEHGASVSKRGGDGLSPMTAVGRSDLETLMLIMAAGGRLTDRDGNGDTVLHSACSYASTPGQMPMVKFLLSRGIDPNARDNRGITPLMLAAKYGCVDILEYLLSHGSNINAHDRDGGTPLTWSMRYMTEIGAMCQVDSAEFLINHGAAVNSRDNEGNTPLIVLCHDVPEDRTTEIADDLLDHGAIVQARNHDGLTAYVILLRAVQYPSFRDGYRALLRWVVKHGRRHSQWRLRADRTIDAVERNLKDYKTVEKNLDTGTDRGGSLNGYSRRGQFDKIVAEIGLSHSDVIYAFYYQGSGPVVVTETRRVYAFDDKMGTFDFRHPHQESLTRYYLYGGKIVGWGPKHESELP